MKTKKLFELMFYINAKRYFTAREVAEEFDMSVRTVQRYLLDLQELGVPLYAEKGKYGGYRVLNNRVLPPLFFSEEEGKMMYFLLEMITHYPTIPFQVDTQRVKTKFYTHLPADVRNQLEQIKDFVVFLTPNRSEEAPLLKDLLLSAMKHKKIAIQYESKTGIKGHIVKPIGIYAHEGLWYFPAYSYKKEKILLFRADRVKKIENLGEDFTESLTLKKWLAQGYVPKKALLLHIEITKEGVRLASANPSLGPHITINNDGTGTIKSVIGRDDLDFTANILLNLGRYAEVIEPKELRESLKKKATEIVNMYT